jgi:hypothetical protein
MAVSSASVRCTRARTNANSLSIPPTTTPTPNSVLFDIHRATAAGPSKGHVAIVVDVGRSNGGVSVGFAGMGASPGNPFIQHVPLKPRVSFTGSSSPSRLLQSPSCAERRLRCKRCNRHWAAFASGFGAARVGGLPSRISRKCVFSLSVSPRAPGHFVSSRKSAASFEARHSLFLQRICSKRTRELLAFGGFRGGQGVILH